MVILRFLKSAPVAFLKAFLLTPSCWYISSAGLESHSDQKPLRVASCCSILGFEIINLLLGRLPGALKGEVYFAIAA